MERDASEGNKASGMLGHFGRLFARLPTILLAILLIPTLWYLIKEGRRYSVIVNPISVPKRLEEVGLTGEVMAGRVAAAMQQIELRSHTLLATDSLAPSGVASAQNEAITSIEMPGTHLSLKVLQEAAQTVFGHPPDRVSGDIVITDPGSATAGFEAIITIRVQRSGHPFDSRTAVVKTDNADVLAHRAATLALQTLNPYVLAVDDEERGDIHGALTLVRLLAEEPDLDRKHKRAAYVLWAKALADQREFSAAIEQYQSAEKWGADDSSLYLSWGATLLAQKDYRGALVKFNRALQLSPTSPAAYNSRAAANWLLSNPGQALSDYGKANELDPKHCFAMSYNNLGVMQQNQKKFDDAIANFKRATECDPTLLKAYSNWSRVEAGRGHLDIAESIWGDAIQADPHSSAAYFALAVLQASESKLDAATGNFHHAIDLDPGESKYYSGLGDLLYDNAQFDAAVVQYDQAVALDDQFALAHNNLGNALRALGRCSDAVSEYNRATALYPAWSAPIHNMGAVLFMRGQFDPAMERFEAALRLDPKDATALTGRARILVVQKRLDDAIQVYQSALNPDNPAAYRELAAVLRSQGKTAQATTLMETFEKSNMDPTAKRDDVRASKESAHCKD